MLFRSFAPILERYAKAVEKYPETKKEYDEKYAEWQKKAKKLRAEGKKVPRGPHKPLGPGHPHAPTGLYNGMIAPILPYAIKGAIWYQGESNGREGISYFHKKKALINGWRQLWNQGDFPFYFVQLANFRKSNPDNPQQGDGWAKVREAQTKCLEIPNTGMAVIIDIGEASNIHPRNKQDVGKRLALWALAKDYKKDVVFSGPLYKSHKVDGNKIIISFDNIGGGLVVGTKKGLEPISEVAAEKLGWISIAGNDKKWHWAKAAIEGNTLVVSSDKV